MKSAVRVAVLASTSQLFPTTLMTLQELGVPEVSHPKENVLFWMVMKVAGLDSLEVIMYAPSPHDVMVLLVMKVSVALLPIATQAAAAGEDGLVITKPSTLSCEPTEKLNTLTVSPGLTLTVLYAPTPPEPTVTFSL